MDSIVANNGFVLGILGQSGDYPTAQAYNVMSNWGLEGTHLSGNYTIFSPPWSPYELEVDLTTMIVTSAGF